MYNQVEEGWHVAYALHGTVCLNCPGIVKNFLHFLLNYLYVSNVVNVNNWQADVRNLFTEFELAEFESNGVARGRTTLGGNQEGVEKGDKNGGDMGHEASHNFWGDKIAVCPGRR